MAAASKFGWQSDLKFMTKLTHFSHPTMTYYLAVVGTLDNPLYETTLFSTRSSAPSAAQLGASPSQSSFSIFGSPSLPPPALGKSNVGYGNKNGRHVMQLVAHASLDVVEDVQWVQNHMCAVLSAIPHRFANTDDPCFKQVSQKHRQVP